MNNDRRKALSKLQDRPAELRKRIDTTAITTAIAPLGEELKDFKAEVEGLRDEEQEFYDNMPEAFQQGEKGEMAQAAIENLDEAMNQIDEFVEALEAINDAATTLDDTLEEVDSALGSAQD